MGPGSFARSVEDVNVPDKALGDQGKELVSVVVELGLNDLVALDQLQNKELKTEGVRPTRSEVIRRAVQFYYEKHQEVII